MRTDLSQLSPHIKYVMGKFKSKLPKDDLKRFAKEVNNSSNTQIRSSAESNPDTDLKEACQF